MSIKYKNKEKNKKYAAITIMSMLLLLTGIMVNNDITIKIKGISSLYNYLNIDITEFYEQINENGGANRDYCYTVVKEKQADIPHIQLSSLNAALVDAATGRILYSKDGSKKRAIASTTKIMTCIIALENGILSDTVTVSKYAASMPNVQLNMKQGDTFILNDLLYSLMLESHNDTAVAIAEHIGGSVENFAQMMNDKAKKLNMSNTNFVTPNGLDAENHYSTAVDMCILGSYAIQNTEFIKITNTKNYTFKEQKSSRSYTVSNKNSFLNQYNGAIGIKTGFTGNAGYCFVGAAEHNNHKYVSAVLASGWPPNKSIKWSDTKKIMEYGKKYYSLENISFNVKSDLQIMLLSGIEENIEYIIPEIEKEKILLAPWERVTVKLEYTKYTDAPIKKNTRIGTINYYINNNLYDSKEIICSKDYAKINHGYIITVINKIIFN